MLLKLKCIYTTALLSFVVIFHGISQQQQQRSNAEITIKPDLKYDNVFTFEVANEPPLKQIAGAPKAHYSYFWELGDGSYSTEKNPRHIYNDKKNGKVKVSLTNNYGTGGVPRLRPKNRKDFQKKGLTEVPATKWEKGKKPNSPLSKNESIKLFNNHSPRPKDPLVNVLSYQNNGKDALPTSGTIYLFYNEKSFPYDNFTFVESRTHHGELFQQGLPGGSISSWQDEKNPLLWAREASYNDYRPDYLPSYQKRTETVESLSQYIPGGEADKVLRSAKKQYRDVLSWKFDQLRAGEQRNIFTSLETTPEMINDTTNTITYKAVMIPDYSDKVKEFTLKMTVQSSHDPNKMVVSHRKIRKGMIKRAGVTYTIKFQNTGRGAASNILIENLLPNSLDPSSIKIKKVYPKVSLCPRSDSLQSESCMDTTKVGQLIKWQFKNIYLPGTRQKDKENRGATKGFIEFSARPKKRFRGKTSLQLQTRAHIYFDKNDPVRTNKVKTKVVKNVSWGLRGGFQNFTQNPDDVFAGITIAPFSPKGIYYQAELSYSGISYTSFENVAEDVLLTNIRNGQFFGDITTKGEITSSYFDIVPFQLRTNISPFVSVGVGGQISVLMKAEEKITQHITYNIVNGTVPFPDETQETKTTVYDWPNDKDPRFTDIETGFFVDVQFGFIRKGPGIGLRYQQRNSKRPVDQETSEKDPRKYFQLYGVFRF
ncbi:hypothetical protein QQ020_32185 [Fulvivirgaceae bacterium BMA12]|uniref:PKD domain-containing protein n=1 Tax=Agaribacillus aureus TaxID=3051825 RepID=A0ABT8LG51_9BACT|nr:hypothetical protein [Fulvivirgaceae bacterium BMA12]